MSEMILITAMHEGKLRCLTVPDWAKLLNVTSKHLYQRRRNYKDDQEVISGNYICKENRILISPEELDKYYQEFNYSQDLTRLWRQKNAVR